MSHINKVNKNVSNNWIKRLRGRIYVKAIMGMFLAVMVLMYATLVQAAVAPATPTGLAVTAAGDGQVSLSWNANSETDIKYYYLAYMPDGGSWGKVTTSGASATVTGLTNGTRYTFKIRVYNNNNQVSGYSGTVTATPQAAAPTGPPATPTGLAVTAVGDGQVSLSWNANSETDIKYYYLAYMPDGGSWGKVTTSGASATVTGLTNGTRYTFKIRVYNNNNQVSGYSGTVTATPQAAAPTGPPATPTGLAVTGVGDGQVSLSWNANSETDIARYYVAYQTAGGNWVTKYTTGTSLTVTGLTNGTVYYFKVKAYSNSGKSSLYTSTVTATPRADIDLVVQSMDSPATGIAGTEISISNTVTNQGSSSTTTVFYISYFLSSDSSIDVNDTYLGQRSISGLAAGASDVNTTSVTIPATVGGGSYYVGAIADISNLVAETDESNNTGCDTGQITIAEPFIDLVVQSIDGPATAAAGNTITVSDTVKNQGNIPTTAFYVRYYLSSDSIIDVSDTYLGERTVSGLAAGASDTNTTSVTIPATAAGGSYYVGAIADATNLVAESDEDNNTGHDSEQITITELFKDLVVQSINGPNTGAAGSSISISDTVKNQGNGATSAFLVYYYLSSDSTIDTSDTYLGQRSVSGLAAGAASTATTSVTIPADTARGSYYLGAIVDATGQVAESDEGNNTGCETEQLAIPLPDLVIQSVNGPEDAMQSESINISTRVSNNGGTAATQTFYLNYYLSIDTTIDGDDIALNPTEAVNGLAAGTYKNVNVSRTIPNYVPNGLYYLIAEADRDQVVEESNENNNSGSETNTIYIGTPQPDLIVSYIDGVVDEEDFTISINNGVRNQGNSATTETFRVNYYLSTDTIFDASDTSLGSRTVYGLSAGGYSGATAVLAIPANVAIGSYYLGAKVDVYNDVYEYNENNNTGYKTTPIALPNKDLIVLSIDGVGTGAKGGTITITDTLKNQGTTKVDDFFYIKYYLSADTIITSSDSYLGQRDEYRTINPGASSVPTTTSVTIPTNIPDGSYYIGSIVDTTNVVRESNENNNTGYDAAPINVAPPYVDLVVQSIDGPASGVIGSKIYFTDTVKNQGNTVTSHWFGVYYYLSSDTTFDSSDTYLGSRTIDSLAGGAVSTAATGLTVPSTITEGLYYLGAIVDRTDIIDESNENNNTRYDVTLMPITFDAVVPVTGVTLDRHEMSLEVGGASVALTATLEPLLATNRNLTWSTTNASVATVVNGLVTPVGYGTADITVATEDGGFNDSCRVSVSPDYILLALTTPVPGEGNSISVGGAVKTGNVDVVTGTSLVVLTGTKTTAQSVSVGGADAAAVTIGGSDTAPTFSVDTPDIAATGGSKVFTLTVSEPGRVDIFYTITVRVASPPQDTADIVIDCDEPNVNGCSQEGYGGANRTVVMTVVTGTDLVVFHAEKTEAQSITIGGTDAAAVTPAGGTDTRPVFNVNTISIYEGGSKTFTLTVSEADHLSIVYTVTVNVIPKGPINDLTAVYNPADGYVTLRFSPPTGASSGVVWVTDNIDQEWRFFTNENVDPDITGNVSQTVVGGFARGRIYRLKVQIIGGYHAGYSNEVEFSTGSATSNIAFLLTSPVGGTNELTGGGEFKTVDVKTVLGTSTVVISGVKTAPQLITIGGTNASVVTAGGTETNPTYTVDTSDITSGGSKTFTLTVSEADHLDIVYTVHVTVSEDMTPL
ncbi:MAG: hypothetical protein HPY50_02810 [Firmicutes bacterium]|nr:hypothetical protein [Bacillota bacterium]